VDAGDDDVAVIDRGDGAPARVLVEHDLSSRLRTVVVQGLSVSRVAAALAGAGLPPATVARLTTAPALDVVPTSGDTGPSTGDVGIGVLVAVVLYVALLSAGTLVASGVAEEKTSRVSEVLLATLRPAELLLGKIAGVGIIAIVQLVVAALPALIAAELVGAVDLPDATASTVAWGLAWFVAGYALYATAYGALGALVGRQQEVGQVTAPLLLLLLAGYLASATVGASHPDGGATRLLSLIPPFSPMVMPLRIAGTVETPEILLALVVPLAFAAVVLWLGAAVYRGGIVVTGARIGLRAALAGRSQV
jgi:ABC-2 type transport system permease protein